MYCLCLLASYLTQPLANAQQLALMELIQVQLQVLVSIVSHHAQLALPALLVLLVIQASYPMELVFFLVLQVPLLIQQLKLAEHVMCLAVHAQVEQPVQNVL
jgi:hypothetical protein